MVDAIAFASAAACGASYLALRSRRRPFATAVRGAFLLGGCFKSGVAASARSNYCGRLKKAYFNRVAKAAAPERRAVGKNAWAEILVCHSHARLCIFSLYCIEATAK